MVSSWGQIHLAVLQIDDGFFPALWRGERAWRWQQSGVDNARYGSSKIMNKYQYTNRCSAIRSMEG